MSKFVAFLRGINVGGHNVKKETFIEIFSSLGLQNVTTVLASGNIIFETSEQSEKVLTNKIETALTEVLGYAVPAILRSADDIKRLIKLDPFKSIRTTKETRRYITFLADGLKNDFKLPFESVKKDFKILSKTSREVFSVFVHLESGKTPEVMNILEKEYGKNITTRNWNTIEKISGTITK